LTSEKRKASVLFTAWDALIPNVVHRSFKALLPHNCRNQ